jgi:DNA-binding IclR family transcriptional regulator
VTSLIPPSLTATRAVWVAISAQPRSSMRALARRTHYAVSTVWHALHILQGAGYISYLAPGHWRVNVPLR